MTESDHDYFVRRAAEEHAAAKRAQNANAERSHLELAHRYEAAAAAALGMPIIQLATNRRRTPTNKKFGLGPRKML